MALLAAGVVWPLCYFAFSSHPFIPRMPSVATSIALLVFTIFSLASIYVSPIIWMSMGYVGMTLCALFIALQFSTALTDKQFQKGLAIYAIAMAMLLIIYAISHYEPGLRLGNGVNGGVFNPNAIGLVSLSIVLSSLAIPKWWVRYMVLALALVILVLTGSRSASVGVVLALSFVILKRTKQGGIGIKWAFVIGGVALSVISMFFWNEIEAILMNFFAVNDAYRGIGSGATGRMDAWIQTWGLFTSHPFFGVGFRAHDNLLHALVKTESSAHNGYLSLLAEIGLFGFAAVVVMVFSGVIRLLRAARDAENGLIAVILLGLCIGYGFMAIFERYLLNVGNPTSLLFILAILYQGRKTVGDVSTAS